MVETFVNVDSQPSLLRIETSKDLDTLQIPSFCKILKEVTQDDNYASSTIAKIGWKMPEEDKKLIQAALNQMAVDKQASGLQRKKNLTLDVKGSNKGTPISSANVTPTGSPRAVKDSLSKPPSPKMTRNASMSIETSPGKMLDSPKNRKN
jgi:hypothetical protein